MKKKLLALLVIGIMVFSLTSCDMELLGKWQIVSVKAGEVVMDQNDIEDLGIDVGYIKLNRSGSCKMNLLGDEYEGNWTESGKGANSSNSLEFTYGESLTATATFNDNQEMIFTDSQGSEYTLTK